MSDIGLFGSVHEQLREYSDQLDRLLSGLRSESGSPKAEARRELSVLLGSLGDVSNKNPASQVVRALLRRELPGGRPEATCRRLSGSLCDGDLSEADMGAVERIALAVHYERQAAMARMRGRP